MSAVRKFKLPSESTNRAEFDELVALLNTAQLTIDQCARGYSIMISTPVSGDGEDRWERQRNESWARLEAFAKSEGLIPPDVAAAAIYFRYRVVMDELHGGYDMSVEDPERYAEMATRPLTDSDFGILEDIWEA